MEDCYSVRGPGSYGDVNAGKRRTNDAEASD